MKNIVFGFLIGAAVMAGSGCSSQSDTIPIKYGTFKGQGIVTSSKFMIIYDGIDKPDAGMFYMTVSGGDRPFSGGNDWNAYEPAIRTATMFIFGRLIQVCDDGSMLRVQNCDFDLSKGKVVVVVDKSLHARLPTAAEVELLTAPLSDYFKNDKMETMPPEQFVVASQPADPAISQSNTTAATQPETR